MTTHLPAFGWIERGHAMPEGKDECLAAFVDALTNAMLVGDYLANLPGHPREGVLEALGALDLAIHYAMTGGEL